MGISQPFQILKMDKVRGNIVVSRRVVLEETRAEARAELIDTLKEGSVLEGVVKNITDYGAFIDLGGVDGLLHVTDISWKRINHPAEVLSVGQTVKVQVIKFNEDNQRISLGMKQLESDPWQAVADKYKVGEVYKGKVTNITDYGAFVELEDGIEGLVHVSEMSWTRKNVHPGKIVSTSQEVEVKVLEVDADKRRISLGIKQCTPNPWAAYVEEHPVGSVIEGKIKNITEFGLFVGLSDEIDGMIHLSDISWDKSGEEAVKDFTKGQDIQAKIIDVDVEKERISLGIKQLSENAMAEAMEGLKKGDVVKATVTSIDDKGVNVEVNGVAAMIKRPTCPRTKLPRIPKTTKKATFWKQSNLRRQEEQQDWSLGQSSRNRRREKSFGRVLFNRFFQFCSGRCFGRSFEEKRLSLSLSTTKKSPVIRRRLFLQKIFPVNREFSIRRIIKKPIRRLAVYSIPFGHQQKRIFTGTKTDLYGPTAAMQTSQTKRLYTFSQYWNFSPMTNTPVNLTGVFAED